MTQKKSNQRKTNSTSPQVTNSKKVNKDILLVTYIFLGLFLILIGYFSYLVGFSSKGMSNNPYNKLQNLLANSVTRGNILSSDGEILATTAYDDNDEEYRYYPFNEEYCHIVGSVDKGLYGLESAYNFELLSSTTGIVSKVLNDFSDKKDAGDSIVTTLDTSIQDAAYNALSEYDGAVIVMDSKTGAVKAMVSNPGYNPNTVEEEWEDINSGESSVLLNRATQGLYTPGSIFKLVTLYEYLKKGNDPESYSFDCDGSMEVDGNTIHCNNNTSHGSLDLMDSFAYSCNSSFMNIGTRLNITKYNETAKSLLFNSSLPIKLEYNKSSFGLKESDSDFIKAQTYFGQGETLMSPIHAAIMVSAIANEGQAMKPYFVEKIVNTDNKTIKSFAADEYKSLFDKDMAETLKEYMRSVVEYGTATRLNNFTNLTVYGKTGSGEIDSAKNINSWFIGFAENEETTENYTIIVVAENVPDGTSPAPSVSIANQILKVLD